MSQSQSEQGTNSWPKRSLCVTYILEAGVVVLADVVQLVDEDVVVLGQEVDSFAHAAARQLLTLAVRAGLRFLVHQ